MDRYSTTQTWTGVPGAIAPADGNYTPQVLTPISPSGPGDYAPHLVAPASLPAVLHGTGANENRQQDALRDSGQAGATNPSTIDLGPNNERLEDVKPKLVHALRELVRQYREEGVVARRNEIRRIRQARLFWQGLQYAWWNPNDMNWHLPYENRSSDDRELEEMPRYQFVTNFYQGFGLSFVAVLSQDVPSVRFYPQSAQSLQDISAARAASDVATLIEQNNHVEQLLTTIGYFLWTDGKLGAYVRYVADGQRFGFHEETVLEALEIPLGEDTYVCPDCKKETPSGEWRVASGDQSRTRTLSDDPDASGYANSQARTDADNAIPQADRTDDSSVARHSSLATRHSPLCALRRATNRRKSAPRRARHHPAHRWHPPRSQRPGSHLHRRRPRAQHAGLGERDARISLPAMAGGSPSRKAQSRVSARRRQNRNVALARRRRCLRPSLAP